MRRSRAFFVCQQGFPVPNEDPHLYAALMLQPRMVGAIVVIGTALQRPGVFLALAAVMAWAALVPSQNLFDALYNYTVAFPRGLPALRVAPGPRRFSQAFAAAASLAIGLALMTGATLTTWVLEGPRSSRSRPWSCAGSVCRRISITCCGARCRRGSACR